MRFLALIALAGYASAISLSEGKFDTDTSDFENAVNPDFVKAKPAGPPHGH